MVEVASPPAPNRVEELAWGSDLWLSGPPPLATAGWYYGGWGAWPTPRAGLNVHLSGNTSGAPTIHVGARTGGAGAIHVGGRGR